MRLLFPSLNLISPLELFQRERLEIDLDQEQKLDYLFFRENLFEWSHILLLGNPRGKLCESFNIEFYFKIQTTYKFTVEISKRINWYLLLYSWNIHNERQIWISNNERYQMQQISNDLIFSIKVWNLQIMTLKKKDYFICIING